MLLSEEINLEEQGEYSEEGKIYIFIYIYIYVVTIYIQIFIFYIYKIDVLQMIKILVNLFLAITNIVKH